MIILPFFFVNEIKLLEDDWAITDNLKEVVFVGVCYLVGHQTPLPPKNVFFKPPLLKVCKPKNIYICIYYSLNESEWKLRTHTFELRQGSRPDLAEMAIIHYIEKHIIRIIFLPVRRHLWFPFISLTRGHFFSRSFSFSLSLQKRAADFRIDLALTLLERVAREICLPNFRL